MAGSASEQAAACTLSHQFVAAQMVWREEVKAALELIRDTDDESAWAAGTAGDDGVEEADAVTRVLKFTDWKKFCTDARKKQMVPTCVIDFPYSDNNSLKPPLLERMYCFKGVDDDWRVVLHVHTLLPWCDRGTEPKKRAKRVTSVNVRHAERKGGVFKQDQSHVSVKILPVADNLKHRWKTMWEDGKGARLEWQWGTAKSMPVDEKKNMTATVSAYDEVLSPTTEVFLRAIATFYTSWLFFLPASCHQSPRPVWGVLPKV